MTGDEFLRLRSELLASAHGEVLELGIGTGLNLPHYPETVTELHAVDPAQLLQKTIAARSTRLSFPVRIQKGTAETITPADRRFDYVISTWTLCTIPDPVLALQEVGKIAVWQDRLNPIQNVIGCGCNLNRQIDRLITQGGLKITHLDRFTMKGVPRLGGEMYRGTAIGVG